MKARTEWRRAARGWMAVVLVLGCFAGEARHARAADRLLNRKAPEFSRRDFTGSTVDMASLRGRVVLLNFWATWCAPCQTEIPVFSKWQGEYRTRGLQVIGVSMDDSEAPAKKLVGRLKPDYPIVMGDAKLGDLYGGVLGLPLTYLIDRKGVVRAAFQGTADLKAMEHQVNRLLTKP